VIEYDSHNRQVIWHDVSRSQWQEYVLKGCHLDIRAQTKKADVNRCVCRWRVLCPNISKLDHEFMFVFNQCTVILLSTCL